MVPWQNKHNAQLCSSAWLLPLPSTQLCPEWGRAVPLQGLISCHGYATLLAPSNVWSSAKLFWLHSGSFSVDYFVVTPWDKVGKPQLCIWICTGGAMYPWASHKGAALAPFWTAILQVLAELHLLELPLALHLFCSPVSIPPTPMWSQEETYLFQEKWPKISVLCTEITQHLLSSYLAALCPEHGTI